MISRTRSSAPQLPQVPTFKRKGRPSLLLPKGDHRIELRGSSRGKIGSEKCDRQEQRAGEKERQRILRRHAVELALDETRSAVGETRAHEKPHRDQAEGFSQKHRNHAPGSRSESDAHSDRKSTRLNSSHVSESRMPSS